MHCGLFNCLQKAESKNKRRDRKRKQIERWKIIKIIDRKIKRKRKMKNEVEIAIPEVYFALTLYKTIDL
jgi:hypothetical protein